MTYPVRAVAWLLFLSFCGAAEAQSPVEWSFSSKKTGDKLYEISLTVSLEEPWHIYSQITPPGGPLPTSITFTKNPILIFQGAIKESGKMITKFEEVFGMEVKYFESSVSFIQLVRLKTNAKTSISGSLEYMVCNDDQCLPPKTLPFNIQVQ